MTDSPSYMRRTGQRWSLWRFNRQNITPERKLEYALLEVDGPALPSVGWWIAGGLLFWIVLENLL